MSRGMETIGLDQIQSEETEESEMDVTCRIHGRYGTFFFFFQILLPMQKYNYNHTLNKIIFPATSRVLKAAMLVL
jgi:hypothetical protein